MIRESGEPYEVDKNLSVARAQPEGPLQIAIKSSSKGVAVQSAVQVQKTAGARANRLGSARVSVAETVAILENMHERSVKEAVRLAKVWALRGILPSGGKPQARASRITRIDRRR